MADEADEADDADDDEDDGPPLYLPEFNDGKRVLNETEDVDKYVTDNSQLGASTKGLGYLRSTSIDDGDLQNRVVPWGRIVKGTLHNGFLKVSGAEVELQTLSNELEKMTFAERWAKLSSGKYRKPVKTSPVRSDAEFGGFCRMASSFKLRRPEQVSHIGASAAVGEGSREIPTQSLTQSFPSTKLRPEAGSALRFLRKDDPLSLSTGALLQMSRPDYLEGLPRGLKKHRNAASCPLVSRSRPSAQLIIDSGSRGSSAVGARSGAERFCASGAEYLGTVSPAAKQTDAEFLSTGATAALSELSQWCRNRFGGAKEAWDLLGDGCEKVSSVAFVAELVKERYPIGELAAKRLLKLLETDDGFVHGSDFVSAAKAAEATPNPLSRSSLLLSEAALAQPDPSEHFRKMDPVPGGEALRRLLDKLYQEDPPVAQLLDYYVEAFGTLRMAFRQLDINGNGLLSKGEFKESMKAMRSRSGTRPIEAHLDSLFGALDTAGTGSVMLDVVLHTLEHGEPLMQRLANFLVQSAEHNGAAKALANSSRGAVLEKSLQPWDYEHSITREEFVTELIRRRYPDWHSNDLFSRLDKDHSGQLSFMEFSALLEPEGTDTPKTSLQIARRREAFQPLRPLGDEQRRKKIEGGHTALGTCTRIPQRSRQSTPLVSTAELSRGCRSLDVMDSTTSFTGSSHIATLRSAFLDRPLRYSELHRNGRHVFHSAAESMPDLCPPRRLGLEQFEITPMRSSES